MIVSLVFVNVMDRFITIIVGHCSTFSPRVAEIERGLFLLDGPVRLYTILRIHEVLALYFVQSDVCRGLSGYTNPTMHFETVSFGCHHGKVLFWKK